MAEEAPPTTGTVFPVLAAAMSAPPRTAPTGESSSSILAKEDQKWDSVSKALAKFLTLHPLPERPATDNRPSTRIRRKPRTGDDKQTQPTGKKNFSLPLVHVLKPHSSERLSWWEVPNEVTAAAVDFDQRQRIRRGHAVHAYRCIATSDGGMSARARTLKFEHDICELQRNRYYVNTPVGMKKDEHIKIHHSGRSAIHAPPKDRPWNIETSIWAPRRTKCDSRDFYDTEAVFEKMVDADWSHVMAIGKLARCVTRAEKESNGGFDNEEEDEVEHIRRVLVKCAPWFYSLFDWYAAVDQSCNEMGKIGFFKLISEADLGESKSERCKLSHIDTIFLEVNAATVQYEAKERKKAGTKKWGSPANVYALSRFEFIESLVRIAINKHVVSGRENDVSDALERLLHNNIVPKVPEECVEIKREFLDKCCYNKEVSDMLETHEELLRLLYTTYSSSPSDGGGRFTAMMDLTEWLKFCSDLVPPAPEKFSLRQQKVCFLRSRMRVANPYMHDWKACNLCFEDFLEAIVRVATIIPMPSEKEVRAAGSHTAGDFMVTNVVAGAAHTDFINSHGGLGLPCELGLYERRMQSTPSMVAGCIASLLSYCVAVIESRVSNQKEINGILDSNEVANFVQAQKKSLIGVSFGINESGKVGTNTKTEQRHSKRTMRGSLNNKCDSPKTGSKAMVWQQAQKVNALDPEDILELLDEL